MVLEEYNANNNKLISKSRLSVKFDSLAKLVALRKIFP